MRRSKAGTPWTQEDLDYLSEHYGVLPDDVLARRLRRSRTAMKIAVTRKLHIRRTDSFYTARMLSMLLGRNDGKIIVHWIHWGWLKATRGPTWAGQHEMWNIVEDDIADMLKQRPWLANLQRMEEHYFRSIVKEEWRRDPWYSTAQVAQRLGLKDSETVSHYVRQGWLAAQPSSNGRAYQIRQSSIESFLENDPRGEHRSTSCRDAKIQSNIRRGVPVKLSITWQLQCPRCNNMVTVAAPAQMAGWQMKERFTELFTNDECVHGDSCSLQADCFNDISRRALAEV